MNKLLINSNAIDVAILINEYFSKEAIDKLNTSSPFDNAYKAARIRAKIHEKEGKLITLERHIELLYFKKHKNKIDKKEYIQTYLLNYYGSFQECKSQLLPVEYRLDPSVLKGNALSSYELGKLTLSKVLNHPPQRNELSNQNISEQLMEPEKQNDAHELDIGNSQQSVPPKKRTANPNLSNHPPSKIHVSNSPVSFFNQPSSDNNTSDSLFEHFFAALNNSNEDKLMSSNLMSDQFPTNSPSARLLNQLVNVNQSSQLVEKEVSLEEFIRNL